LSPRALKPGALMVVGADIVELRPASDIDGMTAVVAAKLARELAGLMRR
jgi:arginase family enzyme